MGERGSECIVEMEISGGGGSVDSIRYFECRRTVLEMLSDRGYAVPPSDLTTTSLPEFRSLFGQLPKPEALGLCVSLRSNPSIKMNDLLVNITKHVLQPKYEVLTADEKQELLKKYRLEDKQLPYMLRTDAIARYYGLEKGQVVKITYSGGMVDSLVTYRCVV